MTRAQLEKYLNKKVRVTLFDNTKLEGRLKKTGTEEFIHDPNLYIPKRYYFLTDETNVDARQLLFRVSHIKKLEVI